MALTSLDSLFWFVLACICNLVTSLLGSYQDIYPRLILVPGEVFSSDCCLWYHKLNNRELNLNEPNSQVSVSVRSAVVSASIDLSDSCKRLLNPHLSTSKYLAFDSHHPAQHKRSVVSTLMHRANTIPSSKALRTEEACHIQDSLQVIGYPTKFIENAAQPRSGPQNHHPDPADLAMVPYVQGISDRLKCTLQQFNIKTAFKPICTLASVFKKPKDRPWEEKIVGIIYRVECKDCDFSYNGESKWCWASRRVEHDPACAASKESAIRQHAEKTTIHITSIQGMKLITSAEFFCSLYTQTLIRTLWTKEWSSQGHMYRC